MFKPTIIITLACTVLMFISNPLVAADGASIYTAKGCAACHGADGKTPLNPSYPKIAGQTKDYTAQQLTDIKSGDRSNGLSIVMKAIMASVTDDEIGALAEYLSSLE